MLYFPDTLAQQQTRTMLAVCTRVIVYLDSLQHLEFTEFTATKCMREAKQLLFHYYVIVLLTLRHILCFVKIKNNTSSVKERRGRL